MGDDLRVKTWGEFIGQERLKDHLETHIQEATENERPLDHVLLCTEPGFGKTTLAAIIADRLGDPFHSFVAPVKRNALSRFFKQWEGGVVLFDEIHRFRPAEQEDLLTLLEDGVFQLGDGIPIEVKFTTIIGATTEPHKLIDPLFDRFMIRPKFDEYSEDELGQIIRQMAASYGLEMFDGEIEALARATGGVPRNAKRFVKGVKALLSRFGDWDVDRLLDLTNMDPDGLSEDQLDYMRVLLDVGGVAGMKTLSAMLRLSASILQKQERLLVKRGFLAYGPKGRELTAAGYQKIRPSTTETRKRAVA